MHKVSYSNNLFAKKYQLENNLRPFNREEVQKLPKDRCGYMPCGCPIKWKVPTSGSILACP